MLAKQGWRLLLPTKSPCLTKMVIILRVLQGNQMVHGSKVLLGEDYWERAGVFLVDFVHACEIGKVVPLSSSARWSVWSPPTGNLLKLNVDAALDHRSNRIGVGLVVRNFYGFILLAVGLLFRNIFDAEIAEAKAILEGIELASSKSFTPLCVESDAKNVVSFCCADPLVRSEIGAIIQNVRVCLDFFNVVSLSFISRSCNSATHSLAKWVLGFNSSSVWERGFPRWLLKFAETDVAASGFG
ncbi:hypothetical protein ACOSP7_028576 [Xanthoceras sorbifolium]